MDKQWIEEITQKVKELELISRVEYVPVFARQSSHYKNYFSFLTLTCLAVIFFIGFVFELPDLFVFSFGFAAVAFVQLGMRFPRLVKFLIPRGIRRDSVALAAREAFVEYEVFSTRERSGVLIFVSELEKAVFVIADKGLLPFVTENEWAKLGGELADHFSRHSTGATLVKSLEQVSLRLAKHFPITGSETQNNPNELADTPRRK